MAFLASVQAGQFWPKQVSDSTTFYLFLVFLAFGFHEYFEIARQAYENF